jgi:hypothetical protein
MGDISTHADGPSSQRAWRITRSWFFLIVASVGLSGATSESEWARKGEPMPLNLSSPGETVLATCPVGRKIASICGQRLGQAVYRFGRPRHIELVTTGLRYSSIPYAASMGSPSCGIRKTRPSPSTKNVRLEKPSDVERSAVILRPSAK